MEEGESLSFILGLLEAKDALLNLMGALDKPRSGKTLIENVDILTPDDMIVRLQI
ncbi:MAG: hypothetical protein QXI39_07245 [Candidatus Bathyarchaeia archaeon]